MSTPKTDLVEFDELLATVTVSIKPILAIKVDSPTTELDAKSAGGQIATLKKRLEARRKELLEPLKLEVERINAAAKRIEAVLDGPDQHVRTQLNAYSEVLRKKREEDLRIQREKENEERQRLEAQRRKEQEELRAKQEAERKAAEAAAKAEQDRIAAATELKQKAAEAEAAKRAKVATLFGGGAEAKAKAEREAAEKKARDLAEVETARKAAEQKAADERKALEANQERERIAEAARLQREKDEHEKALKAERDAIEAQRVKGAKMEIIVEVVDAWAVPRELCRPPEVILADAKKAFKNGMKIIPGLTIREEAKVSLRSESLSV